MSETKTGGNGGQALAPTKSAAEMVKDQKRVTMRRLFESQRPELSKLLPPGMTVDRLERMSLTECVKNPDLLDCTVESWALALQTCAAQGLYPDSALGYMYLIPRKKGKTEPGVRPVKEVQAQRGYQGDMKLWRNTGEVADIWADVVHAKDKYEVRKGLERNVVHVPYDGDDDPGPLRACYAVAVLKDGTKAWVTLTRRDVMRHKESSSADTERDDNPWVKHEEAMWKKTAIHELNKWMPKSSERAEAAARIVSDDQPIDRGKAIDIGSVSLPLEETAPPATLDAAAATLKARQPAAPVAHLPIEPKDCKHPVVPPSLVAATPVGKSVVCVDCGTEFAGTLQPAAREPGEDDGPDPAAVTDAVIDASVKGAVQALAGKPPRRTSRLAE